MDFLDRIKRYKAELQQHREALMQEISVIDARLADCEAAERLRQSLGDEERRPEMVETAMTEAYEEFKGNRTKLALAIIKRTYPAGLKLNQIQRISQERYNVDLNPSTLSVSLSRSKVTGKIKLEGKFWFYVPEDQRQKKDASSAKAEEAPQETEAPAATGAPEIPGGRG